MIPISVKFDTLPYSELLPNNLRCTHWSVRSKVEAVAREEAYILGHDIRPKEPFEFCNVEIIFTLPDKRIRDLDGMAGACKPWLDGLTDAGVLLKDDCWHLKKATHSARYKKNVEGTEIIITQIEKAELYNA